MTNARCGARRRLAERSDGAQFDDAGSVRPRQTASRRPPRKSTISRTRSRARAVSRRPARGRLRREHDHAIDARMNEAHAVAPTAWQISMVPDFLRRLNATL